jgi:DNA-binding PadR family transcriptional regulator
MQHPSPTTDIPTCLGVLADPLKYRIITTLREKPMPVQELIEKLNNSTGEPTPRTTITNALATLKKHGFVGYEPVWRKHNYDVNRQLLGQLADQIWQLAKPNEREGQE